MPNRHRPRRNKIERNLRRARLREEGLAVAAGAENVVDFPRLYDVEDTGNLLADRRKMDTLDETEIVTMISERQKSAEDMTDRMAAEIDRAERQFRGLFEDQEEGDEPDADDNRIFMRKTMEQVQAVFAHLDSLTQQLDPLLTMIPKPRGLVSASDDFRRAKVKEILVNNYLRDNHFKTDVLPRWRLNFLKHPQAVLFVFYDADPNDPDIRIELRDRGNLFIDPFISTGDIKDAAWVIERDVVTEDEADQMIREGHWVLPHGVDSIRDYIAEPQDPVTQRILGFQSTTSTHRGPDRDRMIEVWHYWQAERRGQEHAYGVILGGHMGTLVRWGPNPMPYKGVPYRGKAYLRDAYRPDGVSLAEQYRSIQDVYNTFINLRIGDVLEGIKRKVLTFQNLFDEQSEEDVKNDQRFIRLNQEFAQQVLGDGGNLRNFVMEIGSGESTQHLLQDLQFMNVEGKEETAVGDVFRGQNPQAGATLGQVQEQMQRALGVFRPVWTQEMRLIEEVGEIISVYFDDPDFFGEQRLATLLGPNRYTDVVEGFHVDERTGMSLRPVGYDEMDVDVSIDVVNQAEKIASSTLRMAMRAQFLEGLRHHPELVKEAGRIINFPVMLLEQLRDTGEDIERITYTQEQRRQRAQEEQEQRQQQIQEQLKLLQAESQAKGQERAIGEQARTQGRIAEIGAKGEIDLRNELRTIAAELGSTMREEMQAFRHDILKMREEARLESRSDVEGVGHGENINKG